MSKYSVQIHILCSNVVERALYKSKLGYSFEYIVDEFLQFYQSNLRECVLLEMPQLDSCTPSELAKNDLDSRTDLAKYRIYRNRQLTSRSYGYKKITGMVRWPCFYSLVLFRSRSFWKTWDSIKTIGKHKNIAMRECSKLKDEGSFENVPLIKSMRSIRNDQADLIQQITGELGF